MAEKKKAGEKTGERKRVGGKYPPPEETRWKRGQSGNPKGKPKGTVSLKAALKKEIEKQVKAGKDPVLVAQMLANDMVKFAHKGNMKAMEMIWDRIEGKVSQELNIQGDMGVNLFSTRRKSPSDGD